MKILKDIGTLLKTGYIEGDKLLLKDQIRIFFKLLGLIFLLKLFYLGISLGLNSIDGIDIPLPSETQDFDSYSGFLKFSILAIVAPILEELTFRLGLKFSKRNFIVMISGIIYALLKIVLDFSVYIALVSALAIATFLTFTLSPKIIISLTNYWKNHRLIIFYLLIISFSILHIANYDLNSTIVVYIPLIAFSHVLGGVVFSYARLKYNILLAIGLHMAHNALISFPYLFFS
ncbi:CAAX protease self-immunity [Maribacter aquivivus]|uniref:CAAX protease self-immunity n=1 Tax=Maribacter aquivivus TaxID=228958 RepID=A0A1M6UWJ3_9FLAO|nr:CPBP family glutamic-type intramembrane protease [Maribacter aquivivus]SHK73456.1 CAAX protease self-immunity [Maribacter aquivivus]